MPVFDEMKRIKAPNAAAKGPAIKPTKGMASAKTATGLSMFLANSCQGRMPKPKVEKATAKMNTVKIRVMEVLGIMVAGRLVSCATSDMDSRPTKEMMAMDEPYIKLWSEGN